MNSLGCQGQQVGNGGVGVKTDKPRLQFAVLWVLSKLCSLVFLHLANGLSCLNLLLKFVLLEGAACGLGFKVEQVADHHQQTDHQRVALKLDRGSVGHQRAKMHIPPTQYPVRTIRYVYISPGTTPTPQECASILGLRVIVRLLDIIYLSCLCISCCFQ